MRMELSEAIAACLMWTNRTTAALRSDMAEVLEMATVGTEDVGTVSGSGAGPMNRAAKGRRGEHKARDLLEALGYEVTRAAGSKGMWDLIAWHPTHTRYIQLKVGVAPSITAAERECIKLARLHDRASREIWIWKDREKFPKVEVC